MVKRARIRFFILPEGHWGAKSANEVFLNAILCFYEFEEGNYYAYTKMLVIHFDNFTGQDRNRSEICFYSWLVVNRISTDVEQNFLVPGHSKKECDGAFGCIENI